MAEVQIPKKAVSDDGTDVGKPVGELLQRLNLLGKEGADGARGDLAQADGFLSAFTGPPQTVAVIEAGATAATKWWAAGLGTAVIAVWGAVAKWWPSQDASIKVAVIYGAALVTATLVAAIGYLIASDVKARAGGQTAIIEARMKLAMAMIEAAQAVYRPESPKPTQAIFPLPALRAINHAVDRKDETGWVAIAMDFHANGAGTKYIVKKGIRTATVEESDLELDV